MAASLAGLYGGGYGQSQEDGSGGRSGFFNRGGGKKGFGGLPLLPGGATASQTDQNQSSQHQQQQQNPQYQGGATSELVLFKE